MNIDDVVSQLFVALALLLLASSLSIWIQVFRNLYSGASSLPLRFRWRPVRVPRVALAFTLAMLTIAGIGASVERPQIEELSLDRLQFIVTGTLVEGVFVIAILLIALLLGARPKTDLIRLGFRTDHLGQQFYEGLLGMVASMAPVAILLLVTSPLRSDATEHPFLKLLRGTDSEYATILIFLSAAVVAPLKEELMFRVVLQTWLEEYFPVWGAVLLSSVIFAAVHGIPDSLTLLPLAIILGILYQQRRSYITIVMVHALFNAFNLVATMLSRGELN